MRKVNYNQLTLEGFEPSFTEKRYIGYMNAFEAKRKKAINRRKKFKYDKEKGNN